MKSFVALLALILLLVGGQADKILASTNQESSGEDPDRYVDWSEVPIDCFLFMPFWEDCWEWMSSCCLSFPPGDSYQDEGDADEPGETPPDNPDSYWEMKRQKDPTWCTIPSPEPYR